MAAMASPRIWWTARQSNLQREDEISAATKGGCIPAPIRSETMNADTLHRQRAGLEPTVTRLRQDKNMKNKVDDFAVLSDFENLYNAHRSCRKGKRWKDSVAIYDIRGLECTFALKALLDNGEYRLSPYNCFSINERGKHREIKSIKYFDRVVQKSLMDNILTPIVERTFIDTNCASQKEKGTDYSLSKMRLHMQAFFRRSGADGYILICDMHHYFDSIPHELMNEYYADRFEDEMILRLIRHIHGSIPGGVGVPLGNQLSQLDALLALSPLDHLIKEKLHIKEYGRYMDDFYLIHESKDYLKECLSVIRKYVGNRGMELNEKKTMIVPLKTGVDWIGFRFYMTPTGKVVQKLSKKSIKHHKRKLKRMRKLLTEGRITFRACIDAHEGWKAHAERGRKKKKEMTARQRKRRSMPNTYYLVRKMDKYFFALFKDEIEKEANKNV